MGLQTSATGVGVGVGVGVGGGVGWVGGVRRAAAADGRGERDHGEQQARGTAERLDMKKTSRSTPVRLAAPRDRAHPASLGRRRTRVKAPHDVLRSFRPVRTVRGARSKRSGGGGRQGWSARAERVGLSAMAYTSLLDRLGLHRRELRAWALYDVANSAWMTTVMTAVFPDFFVALATGAGLSDPAARSRFAFASSFSVALVGLLGPVMGAIADFRGSRKAFLGAFVTASVAATAAMAFVTAGHWVFALLTFVLGKVAVTSSLAFYNALLPSVARPDEVDRVSTAGFALGYLGGGFLLAVNLAMIAAPQRFFLPDSFTAVRVSFLSVAVWFALFSIPLFRRVKEPVRRLEAGESAGRRPRPGGAPPSRRRPSGSCASTATRRCSCSPSWSTTTRSTRSSRWGSSSAGRSGSRSPA